MILITGVNGTLGSELKRLYPDAIGMSRHTLGMASYRGVKIAYLTGGTKGFHECEGSEEVFRRDVDGNILLIKELLQDGTFVVFISTEAVAKVGHGAAYSRNRLLVEQFIWTQRGCAIVRPRRFDASTASGLASFCKEIGEGQQEGIFYWP